MLVCRLRRSSRAKHFVILERCRRAVKLGAKLGSCNAYLVCVSIVGNVLRLQQPHSIRRPLEAVVKVHNSAASQDFDYNERKWRLSSIGIWFLDDAESSNNHV